MDCNVEMRQKRLRFGFIPILLAAFQDTGQGASLPQVGEEASVPLDFFVSFFIKEKRIKGKSIIPQRFNIYRIPYQFTVSNTRCNRAAAGVFN